MSREERYLNQKVVSHLSKLLQDRTKTDVNHRGREFRIHCKHMSVVKKQYSKNRDENGFFSVAGLQPIVLFLHKEIPVALFA